MAESTFKNHNLTIFQRISAFILTWMHRHPIPESGVIMLTALVVGAGAGLGAVAFRWMITAARVLFYTDFGSLFGGNNWLALLLIPTIGGIITGPIIFHFAREAKGHGVPEVMEAVAIKGGRIRWQVGAVKAIASAICIGSGGSVGSEGPIAQIGAALGSYIGQLLNLSDERIKNLVACGAGGGIAAVFNAPIAGAVFAMEIILGRLNTVYFGAVVISSVTASVVSHIFAGDISVFTVPSFTLVTPWELILYAILGVLAAPTSVGFSRLLYLVEDFFDDLHKIPDWSKPAIGGVLLGVVGILSIKQGSFPAVFGTGYDTITQVLFSQTAFMIVLALFLLKLLATIFTLGSGSSGGIFAPSLFMGAMLGGAFGHIVNVLIPNATAPAGAYALVGMAAVFAGATHAPMTAILILFEMTNDYKIILPLMLATVISTLLSSIISHESIYTLKLVRKGIRLQEGQDIDVMQAVLVQEVMSTDIQTVPPDMSLEVLSELMNRTHHHSFPVANTDNELIGMVSMQDVERALMEGPVAGKQVKDIATTQGLVTVYPDDPMWKALKKLGTRNVGRVPVVEKDNEKVLIGIIGESDIVRAYNHAIARRAQAQYRSELLRLGRLDNAGFVQLEVAKGSPIKGRRLRDISLPEGCLIVSVRRGRRLAIPDGYTVLQPGDRVTALARDECVQALTDEFSGTANIPVNIKHGVARHGEIIIPSESASVGKYVRSLKLPPDTILVSIQRGIQLIVPHGDTQIEAGDVVEVFGYEDEWQSVENTLVSPPKR